MVIKIDYVGNPFGGGSNIPNSSENRTVC